MKKILYFLIPLATLTSCDYFQKIKPSGKLITKEITQDPIFTINNSSSYDIVFSNEIPKNTVYIKGDEKFVENIQIEFNNGSITFDNKKNTNTNIINNNDVKILVNAPDITSLNIHGASDISAPNYIFKNELKLVISGTGDIDIEIKNESTDVSISGAGDVTLKGITKNFTANISGTGDLDAKQFIAKNGFIGISGVGDAKVHVTEQLNANVSGTGSLSYKEVSNLNIQKSISGVGSIDSY